MNQENERVLGLLILMVIAGLVVPTMAPALASTAGGWLRLHGILVDAAHATFTIPFLGAGPDALRVTITALLLVAALALHSWSKKTRERRAQAAAAAVQGGLSGSRGGRRG